MDIQEFQRSIRLVGSISTVQRRLEANESVSRDELAQAARELDELGAMTVVGAQEMHAKYSSLLHPHLQAAGLRPASAFVPAWDQEAMMRSAIDRFQESARKSETVEFARQVQLTAAQLEQGEEVDERSLASLIDRLDEMRARAPELASQDPKFPATFDRVAKRLLNEAAGRDVSLGNRCLQQDDPRRALVAYDRAFERYSRAADAEGLGLVWLARGQAWRQSDDHDEAENALQRARKCFQDLGDRRKEFSALRALSGLCTEQKRYGDAKSLMRDASRLARDAGDHLREAEAERLIGAAWADEGHFDEAVTCYREALRVAQEVGSDEEQHRGWDALGQLYSSLGDQEEAIRCHENALVYAARSEYEEDQIPVLMNLAMACERLGRDADDYWNRAAALSAGKGQYEQIIRMARAAGH